MFVYALSSFSSYEGWDNPFRPDGEISHEAEELLKLWKEGRLKKGDVAATTGSVSASVPVMAFF